jgi:hypothetical protein
MGWVLSFFRRGRIVKNRKQPSTLGFWPQERRPPPRIYDGGYLLWVPDLAP